MYSMVLSFSIEIIRYSVFNGKSTNFDCISMCIVVWCICIDYDILNRVHINKMNIFYKLLINEYKYNENV